MMWETYFADVCAEAFDAVAAKNEPDLERAEAAAEAQVPVAVVNDESCIPVSADATENGARLRWTTYPHHAVSTADTRASRRARR